MRAADAAFIDALRAAGVVAVIRAASADAAVGMSHALVRGGVLGIEITFSTPDAADAIRRVRAELPRALVGAGTVLGPEQLDEACRAGASFLVSPHLDEGLVARARERGVPFLPGALTPTEVVRAYESGATCVKLFPGSAVGPSYVKALRGPLPHIPLMPTGGVDEKNLGDWFAAGVVAVGMGGNLASGSFEQVETAARRVSAALAAARASIS
ncbi:MAG TPA: bifunctional 4-hydroxy-2-oxoglutarate aldolase/2-dehydro-3-deoxy-phosphogluconate aldolase [Polyangiaceae bacterium]|nr:bifunctional 4-hydroxy-2-oxoglutarate aldolase/2-dehydro-3-deoxy-phosphogluconate aldolase [Polyangiaceae bacterium]